MLMGREQSCKGAAQLPKAASAPPGALTGTQHTVPGAPALTTPQEHAASWTPHYNTRLSKQHHLQNQPSPAHPSPDTTHSK